MATEALTLVARRVGREQTSKTLGQESGWRKLLIDEEAEAIWQKLFTLIESTASDDRSDCCQITQEVFLHLLATQRLRMYLTRDFSDEEIDMDLLSLVSG